MVHSVSIAWRSFWVEVTELLSTLSPVICSHDFFFHFPCVHSSLLIFWFFHHFPKQQNPRFSISLNSLVLHPKGRRYSKFPKVYFYFFYQSHRRRSSLITLFLQLFLPFSLFINLNSFTWVCGKLASLVTNGYVLVLFTIFLFHIFSLNRLNFQGCWFILSWDDFLFLCCLTVCSYSNNVRWHAHSFLVQLFKPIWSFSAYKDCKVGSSYGW